MNVDDNLVLFENMMQCSYRVYRWTYNANMSLVYTNCPPDIEASESASLISFSSRLSQLDTSETEYPIILDTIVGVVWLAAFEKKNRKIFRYHLLGPIMTGKQSLQTLKTELDKRNLSIKLRSQVFRQLEDMAIIPSTVLFQFGAMFHYCITGEKISSKRLRYVSLWKDHTPVIEDVNLDVEDNEHLGIYYSEQKMLQMFREGNPNYREALNKSSTLSYGVKIDVGDSLRQQQDTVITLLVLCSRACIEGGLNPAISYSLSDYYTKQIELCQSVSELAHLTDRMLEEYMSRVQQVRSNSSISKPIQNSCDYISMHLADMLTIDELAARAGYTTYYFSHKFKEEVGQSVKDYIKTQKLEQAKLLLSSSRKSIQDICDDLCFGTRSFFSVSFHDFTGMSPSEYRKKYSTE